MKPSDVSKNKFDIIILTKTREKTYLELINQNLLLINKLIKQRNSVFNKNSPAYNRDYFVSRAQYLQIMSLLGNTYESTIKLILLKRDFCINIIGKKNSQNKVNPTPSLIKFNSIFLNKLSSYNLSYPIGYNAFKTTDKIYSSAKRFIQNYKANRILQNFYFSEETYSFGKCIETFISSNKYHYLSFIKSWQYKTGGKRKSKYLSKITKFDRNNILEIVRKMRNNYAHLPEPNRESNGVFYYMYNYLICLLKKEFPNYFRNKKLIGEQPFQRLFIK